MTAKTAVYGLEYIVEGEPLRGARLALENNAKTIEAALVLGGIAPPAAQDLATLAGRVTAAEQLAAASINTFTQGGYNDLWNSTSFVWVPGMGAKVTIPADGRPRRWSATCAMNVKGGPGWWRYRMDLQASGSKPASSVYFPNDIGLSINPNPTTAEVTGVLQAGASLLGDQAAVLYLEARAVVSGQPVMVYPTVRLTALAN